MGAPRDLLLPASRAVMGLISCGFESQSTAVFDAQVTSTDAEQFPTPCLEQLPPSLATLKNRPPRREPANIAGTETEDAFYIPPELGGEPSVVHFADRLEGRLVFGHQLAATPNPRTIRGPYK
jgi:hypothetical protein